MENLQTMTPNIYCECKVKQEVKQDKIKHLKCINWIRCLYDGKYTKSFFLVVIGSLKEKHSIFF